MKPQTQHRIIAGLFTSTLFCLPLITQAAFITDKIVVEVRTEHLGQGTVLKKIPSGSSVEVLLSEGQYSRIRTADNVTGWVNSTFLTNEKPTQLEYLELLAKSKTTEAKLRDAEEQLANSAASTPAISDNDEIERLKNEAKDARWMKVEMMKARDRAEQAEAKLKSSGKESDNNKQALEKLRSHNKDLEQRLAAALLVNGQVNEQQETNATDPISAEAMVNTPMPLPILNTEISALDGGWTVNMKWFFGSLFTALVIGFIAGLTWLDKRMRRRHGGFRIY
jgi:SH3 domain protein